MGVVAMRQGPRLTRRYREIFVFLPEMLSLP
jgi:hypothetical protein